MSISRNDIACSLLHNVDAWIPKVESIDTIVDYCHLSRFDYNVNSFKDNVKLQQLWIARQVAEHTNAIYEALQENESCA